MLIFAAVCQKRPGPRNVILIVSDALRQDILGCYGGDAFTPNIDHLAAEGTLFENAHSTAPCTLPSSIALTTGSYSREFTVFIKEKHAKKGLALYPRVPDAKIHLGEYLRDQGYDVYKHIENTIAQRSNNLQGFQDFPQSTADISFLAEALKLEPSEITPHGGIEKALKKNQDFLHYLLSVEGDKPFFILKWFMDPHGPYSPPEDFRTRMIIPDKPLNFDLKFYTERRIAAFTKEINSGNFKEQDIAYLRELYKAEVEYMDARIGLILKALKANKRLKNTIIVFTSDHGELFGELGRLGHAHSYHENLVRIPLVFFGPGIKKGRRIPAQISHIDLMPTLQDLLDADYEKAVTGKSYKPALKGHRLSDRILYFDRIFNEPDVNENNLNALLSYPYKLITGYGNDPSAITLYNLQEDPSETDDISAGHPEISRSLMEALFQIKENIRKSYEKNNSLLRKDIDLDKEMETTRRHLKALGYIRQPVP